MKTSRKTAGATLVLTVLVVMLLLAAVVVVTAQLAISARRSSSDQDATLQAQYVAESGVARAQARLGQARTLINQGTLDQATTTVSTLSGLFANFCGVSVSAVNDLTLTPGTIATPGLLCTVSATATATTSGSAVASLIPSSAYTGVSGWSASTWSDLFSAAGSVISGAPNGSGANSLGITGKVALKALNVQKTGIDTYLLNMSVADVTSSAANANTKRSLISSSSGIFSLKIARPPFSTFAQFRNQTTATASNGGSNLYFGSGESFNGPVHTNSQLRVSGSPGPTFYGEVSTSAGSPGSPSIDFNGIPGNCSSNSSIQAGSCPQMYPNGAATYPTYVPSIALPTNNNSQFRAALGQAQVVDSAGLPVAPTDEDIQSALGVSNIPVSTGVYYSKISSPTVMTGGMYVKGDADVKLSTTGSAPLQQVIEITQPPGSGTVTRFQQTASGSWTVKVGSGPINSLSGSFNGMLYVDGNVNMYGDGTNAPDVASNSALTISNTGGDIKLKNSITYADCPISSNCPPGSTSNPNATNVLGFYSATGSVLLDGPTNTDIYVNATILASASDKGFGSVRNSGNNSRKVHLIGGVIEDQSQTVSSNGDGYKRDYVYDTRFKSGYSPPYFPLQQRWVILPDTKFDIGTLRQSQ